MINLQDLIDRFGEKELKDVTDRINRMDDKVIDMAVIDRAIGDAEGEVEGYLNAVGLVSRNNRGRLIYLNDQTPPKALTLKACDIARYYLHENGTTKIISERYTQAIDWLKLVMKNPKMLTGVSDEDKDKDKTGSGVHVIPNPVPPSYYD